MRENNCEVIRRELDELMLDETCSASAAEHLKKCSACREFYQTQTKLRRMVGSLGTVAAPADFDFRLRARIASDSGNGSFHYWPLMQRGVAVAAVLIVFAFGIVVVRNIVTQEREVIADKNPPVQQESPKPVQTVQSNAKAPSAGLTVQVPQRSRESTRSERPTQPGPRIKRPPMATIDFSKQRAVVISGSEPFASDAMTGFPIDAWSQPLKLSLDDGRGNAKTISVPTIRFGSHPMLPNQFAQKGIW